jgi:hypothetical protein
VIILFGSIVKEAGPSQRCWLAGGVPYIDVWCDKWVGRATGERQTGCYYLYKITITLLQAKLKFMKS